MQQRKSMVCNVAAGFELAQFRLSGKRRNRTVTRVSAQQIYFLELIAEAEVGDCFVSDAALPAHLNYTQALVSHIETSADYTGCADCTSNLSNRCNLRMALILPRPSAPPHLFRMNAASRNLYERSCSKTYNPSRLSKRWQTG